MRVYITGVAGFIGFHLANLLLDEDIRVHGMDGMTDYYDVNLKRGRLGVLHQKPGFGFTECMLEDSAALAADMAASSPTSSSTSQRRPGCATALRRRAAISRRISRARIT